MLVNLINDTNLYLNVYFQKYGLTGKDFPRKKYYKYRNKNY